MAVLISIIGCSILPSFSRNNSTQLPDPNHFTATPTPFLPQAHSTDNLPTLTNTPSATVSPTITPQTGMISLGLPRPEDQVNILLLGSDWRPEAGFRTDVVLLLSLNPVQKTAALLSFPRDLYVYIPGFGYERINTTQAKGGFDLTAETLLYNFDVPVDYYMITNFYGFTHIIDALGGITVNAYYELYDRCDLPQAVDKMCYIPSGLNTMNGKTALWYVRSRSSTSDFDRTRRAQEVVYAIAKKMISLNAVSRAPELFNLFINSVETNVPLDLVVTLMPLAADILANPELIQRYAITEDQTTPYIVPENGSWVLIPDFEAIAETIRRAIYP